MLKQPPAGPSKGADEIGIAALTFLAENPDLLKRFLDLSGFEAAQLRSASQRPSFFIGLLDFILTHEATVMDFASAAGIVPSAVGIARHALSKKTAPSDSAESLAVGSST